MNFGEILLSALTAPLATIAEVGLGQVLDKFHDEDPSGHEAAVKAGAIFLGQVARFTDKSKTKIDDTVVFALQSAVLANATKHGIEVDNL